MRNRLESWRMTAATVAIVVLAYGPLVAEFFRNQWRQPQYQYFPFVLGAFGWLLWQRCAQARQRDELGKEPDGFLPTALMVIAWLLLAVAYISHGPWMAIVSLVLLITSRFIKLSRGWQVQYLWGILVLLLLVIPLPLNRDKDLVNWLQGKSSRLSSFLLDGAGVSHLMDGNALILPGKVDGQGETIPAKQFFVDEACSGIVSVLSIIACAVIYGVWRNRPPIHVLLLAVAGVIWATLMNVARITTIAVAYERLGVDWSTGLPHETLGLIIFLFTFLGLISTDYLLLALLAPVTKPGADPVGAPIHYGAGVTRAFDWLRLWGAPGSPSAEDVKARGTHLREISTRFALGILPLIAFGTLATAQVVVPLAFRSQPQVAMHGIERGLALDESALPAKLGELQRNGVKRSEREREDEFGQYSRIYEYQDSQGNIYLLSCDFPFGPEWHVLTVCYQGIGWTMVGDVRGGATDKENGQDWNYLEADFVKPDGESALLMYCVFDENGIGISGPTHTLWDDLIWSLKKQYRSSQSARMFQIQVLTTSPGTVREEQRAAAGALLLEAREYFRRAVTQGTIPTQSPTAGASELQSETP